MAKARPRKRAGGSKLEAKVAADLRALGLLDGCEQQYRFHPTRKWLIDFAWEAAPVQCEFDKDWMYCRKIALEVNGGTYMRGRNRGAHSRGARQRQDYEKWSELSLLGWTVILVDTVDVRKGVHVERVLRAMGRA